MEVPPKLTEKPIQIKEMSYVERAVYRYLRGLFRGIDVLRKRKYLFYSIITLFMVLISSIILAANNIIVGIIPHEIIELLLLVEVILALAILVTAIFAPFLTKKPILTYLGTIILAGTLYISFFLGFLQEEWFFIFARIVFYCWVLFLSISFLGVIHSFFAEWYGAIVWAGNPDGRILFSPIIRLGFLASLSLPIYASYKALTEDIWALIAIPAVLSFIMTLLTLFVIPKKEKGNVFGTILSFFYLYSLYHGVTSFVKGINTPILIVDTILLTIGALYSIQGMVRRAAKFKNPILKKFHEERWVMIILSLGLGYHVTSLAATITESPTGIISSFHMGSFIVCSLIIFIVMFGYYTSSRFRAWFVTMPTSQDAVKEVLKLYGPQAARMAITALLGTSREKMEELIRGAPDTAKTMGRRIFDEVRTWIGEQARKTKDLEND